MLSLRLAEFRSAVLPRILLPVLCLVLPTVASGQAATAAVSSIVAFSGSSTTAGPIVGTDGALYGTTSIASATTGGLIYRAAVDGSEIRTIHQLKLTEGYTPSGGLLLGSDDRLYGTTRLGDLSTVGSTGTIFSLEQDGGEFTILHRFAAYTALNPSFGAINTDGAYPESQLVEGSDGLLYGVTSAGGASGTGTVFKVAPDGSAFESLHAFGAIIPDETVTLDKNADGINPAGGLVAGADGYLYGVTQAGGANGRGTVFRLRLDGSGFETLHVFSSTTTDATTLQSINAEGAVAVAGLTDGGDGFYYGVTSTGGENGFGTLFSMSPDGSVFTVMHHFEGGDGSQPRGALLLASDGRLYGTTPYGGTSGAVASTYGTIFSIARDGTGFTSHYSFVSENGVFPIGKLARLSDTAFVGATTSGGNCGFGTLYFFSLAGDTVVGNTRCGNRRNNDSGGGSTAPALLLILGALGCVRRMRVA